MKADTLFLIGPPTIESASTSKSGDSPKNEEEGFSLLMEIVRLARSEKPYRHLLPELQVYAEAYPKVHAMVKGIGNIK